MWTTTFWKDAFERAIKTFAQVAAASFTAGNMLDMFAPMALEDILKLAAASAIVSVLTSIASSGVGDSESASLVNAKPDANEE
jgi:hypothetical protein